MLQTLHLTKIYKTKGGADVRALDDVNLTFPEKGMVFLLGRSGSGKSTLLNVCGGLDSPTTGAIVVKGRSSTAFSQSDFDSYRNTFVGFIFQEYNILNEFTVEDNIALALELQGKPKDKKIIADLLEQVDLTGYAKRKPNTLSGGQKQRIAIARALVKSPEIIMADEPTGALDSVTGKQVFDTLKKLSKDKLVIVVSHDRDFAETYGDRIIELKDGKVFSDVTKTHKEQEEISENLSVVGNTLCLKKGAKLTEEDFGQIKEFLENAQSDIVIAGGEKEVQTYKEAAHISDAGTQEVFEDSAEHPMEEKTYSPQDSRFIRSKLPLRHALKIGVSGMKSKPFRLVSTIFLCTIAFIFFGVLSTMTFYNPESTFKESLKSSELFMVQLGKVFEVKELWHFNGEVEESSFYQETRFTEEDLAAYAGETGRDVFGGIGIYRNADMQSLNSMYWNSTFHHIAYLPENNPLRDRITGTYPTKEDEVCISGYMAEVLYECKAYDGNGKIIELEKPQDIIGKTIRVSGEKYVVTGIIDSGAIPEKYEELKLSDGTDYSLYSGLTLELRDGLHQVLFVTSEAMDKVESEEHYYNYYDNAGNYMWSTALRLRTEDGCVYPDYANGNYDRYSRYKDDGTIIAWGNKGTVPSGNQVILSVNLLCYMMWEMPEVTNNMEINSLINEIVDNSDGLNHSEYVAKVQTLVNILAQNYPQMTMGARLYNDMNGVYIGEESEYEIIGVWVPKGKAYVSNGLLADDVVDDLWTLQESHLDYYSTFEVQYQAPEGAIYDTMFVGYDHSDEQTEELWQLSKNTEFDATGARLIATSAFINNIEVMNEAVAAMQKVFLYVGLVLAVFAALLLSNFISISITYKKKEIGILRAVGARSFDVFKIFFSESFVITAICVVLAWMGTTAICGALNTELAAMLNVALFVVGPLSVAVLLVVAMVTSVVATFLPVYRAARKKPVESIRAL